MSYEWRVSGPHGEGQWVRVGSGYQPPGGYGGGGEPMGCFGMIGLGLALIPVVCILILVIYVLNSPVPNAFKAGTSWNGPVYQNDGFPMIAEITLKVDSIKNGSFYGEINWQSSDTITKVEGTITNDISKTKDAHWSYVTPCSSNGLYLQFTETKFIQNGGAGIILNVKYYAVVCNGNWSTPASLTHTMSGIWFYPDRPNDAPGGNFLLYQLNSP